MPAYDRCARQVLGERIQMPIDPRRVERIRRERQLPMAECDECRADVPLVADKCWRCGRNFTSKPATHAETPAAEALSVPEQPSPLLPCPACSHKVSRAAKSCPSCGHPLAAITIEQTAKTWKVGKLTGAGMSILGVIVAGNSHGALEVGGQAMIGLGICTMIASALFAWWYHG